MEEEKNFTIALWVQSLAVQTPVHENSRGYEKKKKLRQQSNINSRQFIRALEKIFQWRGNELQLCRSIQVLDRDHDKIFNALYKHSTQITCFLHKFYSRHSLLNSQMIHHFIRKNVWRCRLCKGSNVFIMV